MLDIYKSNLIFICRFNTRFLILAFLLFSPIKALAFSDYAHSAPKRGEHKWVVRYFNSVDENTSIEEMVDFLVSFKVSLEAKGFQVPSLSELCISLTRLCTFFESRIQRRQLPGWN